MRGRAGLLATLSLLGCIIVYLYIKRNSRHRIHQIQQITSRTPQKTITETKPIKFQFGSPLQQLDRFRNAKLSISGSVLLELCQEGQAPRSTTCLKTIQQLVAWCAKNTDFYIISKCNSDEEEQFIREQLLSTPEFGNLRQHEHKLLFCSTLVGRGHIARLLEVACHIDDSMQVLDQLSPFISNLLLVQYTEENLIWRFKQT